MIDIIIITKNNYDQLVNTVNSVVKFNFLDLIVINGGECKKTEQFLLNSRINHLTGKDSGIAEAFNRGISLSKQQYIIFINSGDNMINDKYIKESLSFLNNNNDISYTFGDIIFCDPLCGERYTPALRCSLGRANPCCHQTMIYRRDVFEKMGGFDESYKITMDFEHMCRMKKNKVLGKYISAPPSVKVEGNGISAQNDFLLLQESVRALIFHSILIKNLPGLTIRILLFVIKFSLKKMRMNYLLSLLKKIQRRPAEYLQNV